MIQLQFYYYLILVLNQFLCPITQNSFSVPRERVGENNTRNISPLPGSRGGAAPLHKTAPESGRPCPQSRGTPLKHQPWQNELMAKWMKPASEQPHPFRDEQRWCHAEASNHLARLPPSHDVDPLNWSTGATAQITVKSVLPASKTCEPMWPSGKVLGW